MPAGFFRSRREELTVLYDIGSASVGAALVRIIPGAPPHILFSARTPIGFQREVNVKRFLTATVAAIEDVSTRLLKEGFHASRRRARVDAIHCTFSSPWLLSRPTVVHYEQEKPFAATKGLIDSVIAEERERFLTSFEKGEGRHGAATIIEERGITVRLNGYPVNTVHGQRCVRLSLSLYFSAASQVALQAFEKAIHATFNVRRIEYASFPIAYFSTVRDLVPDTPDFLCVDVAGEVTDILVARGGTVADVSSFPTGKHALARAIVAATGAPDEAALSLASIAATADKTPDPRVKKSVERATTEWRTAFEHALTTIGKNGLLPKRLFLTADPDVVPLFAHVLRDIEFDALGVAREYFDIDELASARIEPLVGRETGAALDVFLGIEALFCVKTGKGGGDISTAHAPAEVVVK